MKRQHFPFLLLVTSALSLSGCGKTYSFDKDVKLDYISPNIVLSNDYFAPEKFNYSVDVGKKVNINVKAIPTKFAEEAVFKSLNTDIATVDEKGVVTGVSKGYAKVEISTKDGSRKEIVDVHVNETVKKAGALTVLNNIYAKSQDSSYVPDTTLWAHEIVKQDMVRENAVYNSAEYIEELAMVNTLSDTYFMVTSQDIMIKTESGAPEVSNGTWRFYVDQASWVTYLIHETSSAKRYVELSTQSYMGVKERVDIIYDVLDMFFVAGRSIVTEMFDDAAGKDQMGPKGKITEYLENAYENVKLTCKTASDEALNANAVVTYEDQIITSDDEFEIEIPAGTHCDYTIGEDYFLEKDRMAGWEYSATLDYELEGKKCQRIFTKSTRYDREFECFYPDLESYAKVDTIYDL